MLQGTVHKDMQATIVSGYADTVRIGGGSSGRGGLPQRVHRRPDARHDAVASAHQEQAFDTSYRQDRERDSCLSGTRKRSKRP